MSAAPEDLVKVSSIQPIFDNIATSKKAWDDQARSRRLSHRETAAWDKLDDLYERLLLEIYRMEEEMSQRLNENEGDPRRRDPAAAFGMISMICRNLNRGAVEPLKYRTLVKQTEEVVLPAREQCKILIDMWSVVVREPGRQDPKDAMGKAIRQAKETGLYELLVRFGHNLCTMWPTLTKNDRERVGKGAERFRERGVNLGGVSLAQHFSQILQALIDARDPGPGANDFLGILTVLARPYPSSHHADNSQHSLARVSPRTRAIYGFSSAI